MAAPISSSSPSQRWVDPSTSLSRKVTTPVGSERTPSGETTEESSTDEHPGRSGCVSSTTPSSAPATDGTSARWQIKGRQLGAFVEADTATETAIVEAERD